MDQGGRAETRGGEGPTERPRPASRRSQRQAGVSKPQTQENGICVVFPELQTPLEEEEEEAVVREGSLKVSVV